MRGESYVALRNTRAFENVIGMLIRRTLPASIRRLNSDHSWLRSADLATLARADRCRSFALAILLLSDFPSLALEDFPHPVQHLLLVFRALAVLDVVRWRDDDGFVDDHLLVVPPDGHVAVVD